MSSDGSYCSQLVFLGESKICLGVILDEFIPLPMNVGQDLFRSELRTRYKAWQTERIYTVFVERFSRLRQAIRQVFVQHPLMAPPVDPVTAEDKSPRSHQTFLKNPVAPQERLFLKSGIVVAFLGKDRHQTSLSCIEETTQER